MRAGSMWDGSWAHSEAVSNRKVEEARLPHPVPHPVLHLLSVLPQSGCFRCSCCLVLLDPGVEVFQAGSEVRSKVEHGLFGF